MKKVILLLDLNQRDYKKIMYFHKIWKIKNQICIPHVLV